MPRDIPDLTSELDAIGKRLERPWTDATFGTVCTEDAPRLLAAVRAVLELHQPLDRGTGPQCQGCATHVSYTRWPCLTYQAITRALTGKEDGDGA